jgi:hypothetical protein
MEQLYDRCLRCGRSLKGDKSRSLGYGPTCYQRHLKDIKPKTKKLCNVTNCKEEVKN